jgi:hypothetical protein
MPRFSSPLDNVHVAAPCPADWNQMSGTERVRFCQQCNLNVYNLSSMTKREAEAFVSNAEAAEGRVCIRYYRRRDGTILTSNCPVGLGAIKRRLSRTATALVSALLGLFAGLGAYFFGINQTATVKSNSMGVMGSTVVIDEPRSSYAMGDFTMGTGTYKSRELPIAGQMEVIKVPQRRKR